MKYFTGQSVDYVWKKAAKELISNHDYRHAGRSGETLEILPCTLRVTDPRQRWILSRQPPYNPAFGLVEFIWMITGHDESIVPKYWNSVLPKFSGDGERFYGAYGHRLRKSFGIDQIKRAFEALRHSPKTRQVVLQIWNADTDLPNEQGEPSSKDIPCNLISLLKIRDGSLHWTQIVRSNDIMLGLPYNFIQFTMLQELMAGWLGCDIGEYFHLSDSLHVYVDDLKTYGVDLSLKYPGKCAPRIELSFEESEKEFFSIYNQLLEIAKKGCQTEDELKEVFGKKSLVNSVRCPFLQDILAVIGSDTARRQKHKELARHFIASCSDEGLRLAAELWFKHKENAK